jgi:uncharacterized OB-fold protein
MPTAGLPPTDPLSPGKPIPIRDETSAPFFDGALHGRLMLLRCAACATFSSPIAYIGVPMRARCVNCFSGEFEWASSSGSATLYSFVLMHQLYDEAFAEEIPYNISVVETDEGVRLTSQVVGCPNDQLRIGMALEVTFERLSDDIAIPKFRPLR